KIKASYAGDANFTSSASAIMKQTVNKGQSSMVVTSSLNPSVFGQTVTFTAVVSAVSPAPGTPTGTVTFLDGKKKLGTATLSAGTATFAISSLSAGTHTITASYGGDANFISSATALTQTVNLTVSTATTTSTLLASDALVQQQTVYNAAPVTSPAAALPAGPGAPQQSQLNVAVPGSGNSSSAIDRAIAELFTDKQSHSENLSGALDLAAVDQI